MIRSLFCNPISALIFGMFALIIFYAPGLPADMIMLDDVPLTHAPQLTAPVSAESLKEIFTVGSHVDYYPIRDLSYVLDFHVFDAFLLGYRVHQFALYFLLLLLSWILIRDLGASPWAATAAVAVWGFHPVHAEMLMWIAARKDLLAIIFAVAASILFLRGLFAASLVAFAFSLMSKASFGLLPLATLAAIAIFFPELRRRRGPMITLAAGSLMGLAWSFFQSWFYSTVDDMRLFYPAGYRIEASAAALGKELYGWVNTSVNIIDVYNWGRWLDFNEKYAALGIIAWTAMIGTAVWAVWKRKPRLGLAVFIVSALYAPTSGLAFPHRNFFSTRYLEPAMLVCIFAVMIALERHLNKKTVLAFFTGLPLLYAYGNYVEGRVWDNPIAVAEKAIADQPDSINLKARLLSEVRNSMRLKPPTVEIIQMEATLSADLDERCDQAETDSNSRDEFDCWLYYLIQLNHRAPSGPARDYARLFEASSSKISPLPHSIYKIRFAESLRGGTLEKSKADDFLRNNPYAPMPEYRYLTWIAKCELDGPVAARDVFIEYLHRHLVDPVDAVSNARDYPPPVVDLLRGCFPEIPNVHI